MAIKIASLFSFALAATTVSGHAFFHTGYVKGQSQGHLFGVRAPQSNSPIQDVSSSAMACNSPLNSPVSTDVIEVAPGDKFGMQWNHNLAGPSPGDGDDPIAPSHKGPVMAYMAKVDDASSNTGAGLDWFKVAEEGLDTSTGKWGVDTLIANAGQWSFNIPSLAPGDYLLRGEIIALHSAGSSGEAQFYMSCAAIRVTGSGTCAPSDTVSFPGAYKANDPGVLISIYGNTGKPDNGGKAYTIPGPAVATCDGSSTSPSTTSKAASSSSAAAVSSSSASVSISATPTTAVGVISSTTAGSSSVDASSAAPSTLTTSVRTTKDTTTTARVPDATTTLRTVTGTAPANNGTRPAYSWTWSRPQHTTKANTRTSSSLFASGVEPTSTSTRGWGHGSGNGNGRPTTTPRTSVAITNEPTDTKIAIPSSTAAATATAPGNGGNGGASGTSPAQPSSTGYPMTGPGGKKFMCYEVTDF